MSSIFKFRIYYDDTDAGGVVYHSNYLKFFERARSKWQISTGYNLKAMEEHDAFFVVRAAELDFLYPARLFDEIQIISQIIKIGKASLVFTQSAQNLFDKNTIYCKGEIKIACVNHLFKPREIPEILKKEMMRDF
jgi:acyl-CoA thioester hydrolase